MNIANQAFQDVTRYPEKFLLVDKVGVRVPATYKKTWDDGFGARGWKLNCTIGDPTIIASTRYSGERVSTSVFVHDILDHLISGFGVSGHRSEAMALIQLAGRTMSDPMPDYEQLSREIIVEGSVNGESLMTFLPANISVFLPTTNTDHLLLSSAKHMTDMEIMDLLIAKLGKVRLTKLLVDHFFTLGREGVTHAKASWEKLGLDYSKRPMIGQAIQNTLQRADIDAEISQAEMLEAEIIVGNDRCALKVSNGKSDKLRPLYVEVV